MRVDETPVGDTSGREYPRAEQNRQRPSNVLVARRFWIAVCGGDVNLPRGYWKCSSSGAGWGLPSGWCSEPCWPRCPVVAGGPIGPCETPSPSSCGILEPLEHLVLIHADPAGQHAAVGTLSPSDCYPAGPAGPYVAGGPVGLDVSFRVLEPLEHLILDHADPVGQHAAVGTLSPSDCYPAGPCVAGGPVSPDDYLQVLEPLEHSVLDHADPAGQHADVQDTVESLEHSVLETILDGRPMEGITCPELLECALSLLDTTLDGGLVERISDWEPVAHLVLDGRLMGGDYQPGAFGSRGVSVDSWRGTIGAVGS